jgi:hypothetical protein
MSGEPSDSLLVEGVGEADALDLALHDPYIETGVRIDRRKA